MILIIQIASWSVSFKTKKLGGSLILYMDRSCLPSCLSCPQTLFLFADGASLQPRHQLLLKGLRLIYSDEISAVLFSCPAGGVLWESSPFLHEGFPECSSPQSELGLRPAIPLTPLHWVYYRYISPGTHNFFIILVSLVLEGTLPHPHVYTTTLFAFNILKKKNK